MIAEAFAAAASGFLIYMAAPRPELLVLTRILFDHADGATLQSTMYLMARYGGLKNFGKIFGVKTSVLTIGTGGYPCLQG